MLLQGYPKPEYLVIDGGSTDGSDEIIRKYAPWLAYWVSERDRGQSHAINKGWAKATGDLVAYLCSDGTYLPGALALATGAWTRQPDAAAVVGGVQSIDAQSRNTGWPSIPRLPVPAPLDLSIIDHEKWFLPQPSGFWSRSALDQVGLWRREDLHYTMDRELYDRLCRARKVVLVQDVLATYRFHEASKTASHSTWRKIPEIFEFMAAQNYMVFADTFINTIFAEKNAWIAKVQFMTLRKSGLTLAKE